MAGGGSNLLDGGPGSDVLISGLGNNLLVGGSGNDFLIGGSGSTIMYGGGGSNSFDYGLGPGIVLDYNPSNGDTVAGECKILNNMGTNIDSEIEIKPPG
jgi:Ca2+-binding RTX toxin-like protein